MFEIFNKENWPEVKEMDFFGLKVKYAIWIVPLPFISWGVALILRLLLWLGIL